MKHWFSTREDDFIVVRSQAAFMAWVFFCLVDWDLVMRVHQEIPAIHNSYDWMWYKIHPQSRIVASY